METKENLIGAWAFFIGVILAVIAGFFHSGIGTASTWVYSALVILGILVGILNAGGKESVNFLLASLALVIVSGLGQSTLIFLSNINPILYYLNTILSALLVMFVPATIIVALKTVFSISRVN